MSQTQTLLPRGPINGNGSGGGGYPGGGVTPSSAPSQPGGALQHYGGGSGQVMSNGVQQQQQQLQQQQQQQQQQQEEEQEEEREESPPEIDITINNVVCSFSVRCHLNLRDIALRGINVEYRKENGMVTMKLRRPYTTASMWSSGKITCTGANSEDQAKVAARRYARLLQKLGFNIRFRHFRVVNVLGTCTLPFALKITQFSQKHRERASYEPELHPGVTYKLREPKATLKIFSTGSITVTAPSVRNVQAAIEHIFPLVYEFQKPKTSNDVKNPIPEEAKKSKKRKKGKVGGSAGSSNAAPSNSQSTQSHLNRQNAKKRRVEDTYDTGSDESLESDDE